MFGLGFDKRSVLLSLIVCSAVSFTTSFSPATAKGEDAEGRAGSWRRGTQGSPSLSAAKKKVDANPKDANAQNDLGWALRQNGDLQGAEESLRESIKLNPSSPYPHSNLSVVLLDTNRPADALAEAKKAVALNDKEPIFLVVLGNALDATGDRKAAITQYQAALKIRPDYENAMYNLGRVQNDDGQTAEAKATLSQALDLDDKDERVMKLLDKILQ